MHVKEMVMEVAFIIAWGGVVPLLGLALGLIIYWGFEIDNNQEEDEDGEI